MLFSLTLRVETSLSYEISKFGTQFCWPQLNYKCAVCHFPGRPRCSEWPTLRCGRFWRHVLFENDRGVWSGFKPVEVVRSHELQTPRWRSGRHACPTDWELLLVSETRAVSYCSVLSNYFFLLFFAQKSLDFLVLKTLWSPKNAFEMKLYQYWSWCGIVPKALFHFWLIHN